MRRRAMGHAKQKRGERERGRETEHDGRNRLDHCAWALWSLLYQHALCPLLSILLFGTEPYEKPSSKGRVAQSPTRYDITRRFAPRAASAAGYARSQGRIYRTKCE